MDNTGEMLNRLRSLSDEELELAIRKVARSLGANERMASRIAADRQRVRKRLDTASEAELKRAVSRLNADQLNSILAGINSVGGKQNGSK